MMVRPWGKASEEAARGAAAETEAVESGGAHRSLSIDLSHTPVAEADTAVPASAMRGWTRLTWAL